MTYSLPAASLQFMTFLPSLYLLKFSTDVLALSPAAIGLALGIARLWDAFSDPLAGHWSDRTRSRLGRRRPWLLAASLPIALSFWAVWSPPALPTAALTVWMSVALVLYYTAYSAAFVPHLALGAELTLNYHERSRLATGRGLMELVGMLTAALAMGLLGAAEAESKIEARAMGADVALVFGLASVVIIGFHVSRVRERTEFQGRGAMSAVSAAGDVRRNPHARVLLAVVFIETLSLAFLGALFPFFAEQRGGGQNPGVAMAGLMVVALVSVPGWLAVARRVGKKIPWMIAIAGKGVGFLLFYIMDADSVWLSFLPLLLIGAGQACSSVLPNAMQADVIDYDELASGERKEGAYFAAWNVATKLASAVAIGASGAILSWTGHRGSGDGVSESALTSFQALGSIFPFVLHIVALILLSRYALDGEEHARIRRAIERTASGQGGAEAT